MINENKPITDSQEQSDLNISKSTFPVENLPYNEWCEAFRVSSNYIESQIFDMYKETSSDLIFKWLKNK